MTLPPASLPAPAPPAQPLLSGPCVQPEGALLVLGEDAATVRAASEGVGRLLLLTASQSIGLPLAEVLPAAIARAVEALGTGARSGAVALPRPGTGLQALFHAGCARTGEPSLPPLVELLPDPGPYGRRRPTLAEGSDLWELAQSSVALARQDGFWDRVVVVRLGESGIGEVIADAASPAAIPVHGLFVPPPRPGSLARLKAGRPRLVADRSARPDLLLGDAPASLGLERLLLRAPSPATIAALAEQSVAAQFLVPIRAGGTLWGWIACRNRAPLWPGAAHRALVCALARALGHAALHDRRGAAQREDRRLAERLGAATRLFADRGDALRLFLPGSDLAGLLDADGILLDGPVLSLSVGRADAMDAVRIRLPETRIEAAMPGFGRLLAWRETRVTERLWLGDPGGSAVVLPGPELRLWQTEAAEPPSAWTPADRTVLRAIARLGKRALRGLPDRVRCWRDDDPHSLQLAFASAQGMGGSWVTLRLDGAAPAFACAGPRARRLLGLDQDAPGGTEDARMAHRLAAQLGWVGGEAPRRRLAIPRPGQGARLLDLVPGAGMRLTRPDATLDLRQVDLRDGTRAACFSATRAATQQAARLATLARALGPEPTELVAPIRAIRGFAAQLEGRDRAAAEAALWGKAIDASARHLERLLAEGFAQGAAPLLLHDSACDLALILDEAVRLAAPEAAVRLIELDRTLPRGRLGLRGDRTLLVQAVTHLLTASLEATQPTGRVTARAFRNGRAEGVIELRVGQPGSVQGAGRREPGGRDAGCRDAGGGDAGWRDAGRKEAGPRGGGVLPASAEAAARLGLVPGWRGAGLGSHLARSILAVHGGGLSVATGARGETWRLTLPRARMLG